MDLGQTWWIPWLCSKLCGTSSGDTLQCWAISNLSLQGVWGISINFYVYIYRLQEPGFSVAKSPWFLPKWQSNNSLKDKPCTGRSSCLKQWFLHNLRRWLNVFLEWKKKCTYFHSWVHTVTQHCRDRAPCCSLSLGSRSAFVHSVSAKIRTMDGWPLTTRCAGRALGRAQEETELKSASVRRITPFVLVDELFARYRT